MNNKELADAVVALGVGYRVSDIHYALHDTDRVGIEMLADKFVRDWRVAGALMDAVIEWGGFSYIGSNTSDTFQASAYRGYGHQRRTNHAVDESLPRAIIEACVAALSTDADKQEE